MKQIVLIVCAISLINCTTRQKVVFPAGSGLRFIGEYSIPLKQQFKGTTVGGLSGIDYDAKKDIYYLVSDDGSKINPARFYTAKIKLTGKGFDTVELLDVHTLLDANGSIYTYSAIDPEAIRYHPLKGQLFWCSEGEKIIKKKDTVLFDPSINVTDLKGQWRSGFELTANMRMQKGTNGPRSNSSFEGLTFSRDYKTMYVIVEEPFYEDGPGAGTGDSTAWTRILKFDVETQKPLAQYVYPLEPVAYPPLPAGAFRINGASEAMCVGENQLLVMERSFSTGRKGCVIKLFLADLSHATDVSSFVSVKNAQAVRPVSKKLILNMETVGIPIYNVEGMTLGPRLPNGHQSLLFVADDNFSPLDKTQFLLFEIVNGQ
ncbi:MAG TPA: esterase-like activity of phytase family protein [Flavisolibacter sp.]|nr:esterase-like activity of phytase family protein [Flavisolibacter sp.]